MADVLLDVHQVGRIIFAGETDRGAACTGAGRSADTVHIVFAGLGQVEIEHVTDFRDMQAARGDIGGHEDLEFAVLEFLQQGLALFLRHVTGQQRGFVVIAFEPRVKSFGDALGVDENDAAGRVQCLHQSKQQRYLLVVRRVVHGLVHLVRCGSLGLDAHGFRVVHVFIGQFQHAVRQRGREQHAQALFGRRAPAQQVADILDEAKVEHAVGFVQYHDLAGLEIEHVLLEIVDDASGRSDQYVDAGLELLALLVVASAAVGESELEPGVAAEQYGILVNLDREFARRRQHQRPRLVLAPFFAGRLVQKLVERRDQERGCFTGSGLGFAGNVPSLQGYGQGLLLDRRAVFKARIGQALVDFIVQVEAGVTCFCQVVFAHGA